jgi:hypothetical protein
MYACGGASSNQDGMIALPGSGTGPTYIYIQGNKLSYPCSTSSSPNVCRHIHLYGDHILAENNDLSHSADAFTIHSSHTVVRNNFIHDFLQGDCLTSSQGGNGSNCHFDWAQTEPAFPVQFIVVEGNYGGNNQGGYDNIQNSTGNGHGFLMQGNVCPSLATPVNGTDPCSHYIVRYNTAVRFAGGMIIDDNAASSAGMPGFSYVKNYNNFYIDVNYSNPTFGGTEGYSHFSTHGGSVNNFYLYTTAMTSFNPYSYDSANSSPFDYGNSVAFCTTDFINLASPCTLYNHQYSTGHLDWTADPGNVYAHPHFVNYTGSVNYADSNFGLTTASTALLNKAIQLTTVAAGDSGSGTSLFVNDAAYFTDGFGLEGVQPDGICVGPNPAAVTCVKILGSIDYATNMLPLASSIPRLLNDKVYLQSKSDGVPVISAGLAANIGAALPPTSTITGAFAFGNQSTSAPSAPLTITITNTGGSPLTCSSAVLTTHTVFVVTTNGCTGTVNPGGTFTVSVTFTPLLAQFYSDTLTITSTDPNSPQTVSVSGTGVGTPAPTGTLTPSALAVRKGSTFTLAWTSSGATSGTIDNGVGAVTPIASGTTAAVTVTWCGARTLTLNLSGAGGTTPVTTSVYGSCAGVSIGSGQTLGAGASVPR